MATTVVLADDHDLVREGIARLLESFGDIEVVAHAGDGHQAIQQVQKHQPDLVFLDISMPKLRGIEVIKYVRRLSPKTKIIVLSMHNKEKYIQEAIQSGAEAYLLKESAIHELQQAVECVLSGGTYTSAQISQQLFNTLEQNNNKLTERERHILKLLAEGHSTKKIAELLFISPKTVETHRHRINRKLQVGSIAELVKYAIREELIVLD